MYTISDHVPTLPHPLLPVTPGLVFLAGLGSGVTEAVLVVTPTELLKIRMQAQFQPGGLFEGGSAGLSCPPASGSSDSGFVSRPGVSTRTTSAAAIVKYRDAFHTAAVVTREEGVGALYTGLAPTVLRQGINQVGGAAFLYACCYQNKDMIAV